MSLLINCVNLCIVIWWWLRIFWYFFLIDKVCFFVRVIVIVLELILNFRNWIYFVGLNMDLFLLIVKLRVFNKWVVCFIFCWYFNFVLFIKSELFMYVILVCLCFFKVVNIGFNSFVNICGVDVNFMDKYVYWNFWFF